MAMFIYISRWLTIIMTLTVVWLTGVTNHIKKSQFHVTLTVLRKMSYCKGYIHLRSYRSSAKSLLITKIMFVKSANQIIISLIHSEAFYSVLCFKSSYNLRLYCELWLIWYRMAFDASGSRGKQYFFKYRLLLCTRDWENK